MWHADDGQLNALLDGELSADESREVQEHLKGCSECARRLEEARAFLAGAGELLAVLVPPASTPKAPEIQEPPLVAPLSRGPADSGSTRKADRSTAPRIVPTAKEVAVNLEGRTALTPAIRPVTRIEEAKPPKRPWDLEKLAWAASLILCLGVGYLANEVKNLNNQRETDALARVVAPAEESRVPAIATAPAANSDRAQRQIARDGRADPAGERRLAAREPQRTNQPAAGAADASSDLAAATPPAATPPKPPRTITKPPPASAQPRPMDGFASRAESPTQGAGVGQVPAPAAAIAPLRDTGGQEGGRAMRRPTGPPAPDLRARGAPSAAPAPREATNRLDEIVVTGGLDATTFQVITIDDAVRRLSGTIRLIDGMQPSRVEVGPGRLVPGADSERDLVRVIYTDPRGSRVVLDQQVGDVRTGSFNGVMPGDTLVTQTENGATRIRWVDRKFWMSLSASGGPDSVRALIARVR